MVLERFNSNPSEEAQNVNFPINDVMITIPTNFGTIGNVGHTVGNNIGGVEITIPPKATKRVNQLLAMEPSIHVPLMHAPKNLQVSNNE
jgi:flagellar capping protein FliD